MKEASLINTIRELNRSRHYVNPHQPPKTAKKSSAKKRAGRPPSVFNRRTFEELCKIQCTKEEIARVMGMSIQTILRRCREIYGATFEQTYQRFGDAGLVSLRRAQFKLAKTNASMAIFLGKNYLGQSDQGYTDHELARAIDREMAALRAANGPAGSHS